MGRIKQESHHGEMVPDASEPSRLSVVLKTGSFRQVVLGYVVGAWAVLEIVVTVADLAGWSLAVPRWLVVILVLGLVLVVAAAAMLRGARALQASSSKKVAHRREALSIAAGTMALLPMFFVFVVETSPAWPWLGGGSIQWIMWRDPPIWAAACAAVAIILGLLWVLSRPASSDNGGVP